VPHPRRRQNRDSRDTLRANAANGFGHDVRGCYDTAVSMGAHPMAELFRAGRSCGFDNWNAVLRPGASRPGFAGTAWGGRGDAPHRASTGVGTGPEDLQTSGKRAGSTIHLGNPVGASRLQEHSSPRSRGGRGPPFRALARGSRRGRQGRWIFAAQVPAVTDIEAGDTIRYRNTTRLEGMVHGARG